jgi:hypothetical protein
VSDGSDSVNRRAVGLRARAGPRSALEFLRLILSRVGSPGGQKPQRRGSANSPGNYLVQTRLQTGAFVNSQVSIKAGEAMELGVADPMKGPEPRGRSKQ